MAVEPTKRICLVAGSTGLIGNFLVKELAKSDIEVIALTRNEYFSENQQVIYKTVDFDKKESFEQLFKNVTDVFICLGTTINKAGSKESFRKVDVDYSFSIAEAASKASVPNLSLVTSIGADSKSNNFYLKCKGEVEELISSLPFQSLFKKTLTKQNNNLIGVPENVNFDERDATTVDETNEHNRKILENALLVILTSLNKITKKKISIPR